MAEVDPLPLVPVTWMDGMESCGSPSSAVSARMRSSVGRARRRGMCASKSMCESSQASASSSPSKGGGTGVSTATGSRAGRGQDAARRERVDLTGAPPSGTSVGATRSSTTERSTTHLPTSVRLGRSYITSSSTSSRMARRPRAPVPRSSACSATASSASGVNSSSTLSSAKTRSYCRVSAFLGSIEDLHQRVLEERRHRAHHGQAADELGDEPELDQVLGQHVAQDLAVVALLAVHLGPEADAALADAPLDQLVQPGERAAADEQDVRGVDLDELLVRVLAPALGRHRGRRALEDLEQRLLHALARHVAGDGRVLALAGDLVDLVDVDDPGLGPLHVVVGRLDQLQQDVLDVLAHVARLGQRGGVGDGEGHVEHAGQGLGQQRLAAAGGPEQQDVGLGQLDAVLLRRRAGLHPLVVVVDGDREDLLGVLLPDDVVVEEVEDLAGLGQVLEAQLGGLVTLLGDDVVAQVDALVADVDARTRRSAS